jgi:hypothetical protein
MIEIFEGPGRIMIKITSRIKRIARDANPPDAARPERCRITG